MVRGLFKSFDHFEASNHKGLLVLLFIGTIYCRYLCQPLSFTVEDLHLDDVTDVTLLTPSFLIKRASDAITFRDDDVKETDYEYSYKTDTYEHAQKGMVVNGELSVVGAYTVQHPNGLTQTTMYVADKNGYRPQIQLRFSNLLKSAVG